MNRPAVRAPSRPIRNLAGIEAIERQVARRFPDKPAIPEVNRILGGLTIQREVIIAT